MPAAFSDIDNISPPIPAQKIVSDERLSCSLFAEPATRYIQTQCLPFHSYTQRRTQAFSRLSFPGFGSRQGLCSINARSSSATWNLICIFLLRPFMQSPFPFRGFETFLNKQFSTDAPQDGRTKIQKTDYFPILAKKKFSSLITITKLSVCQKRAKKRRNPATLQLLYADKNEGTLFPRPVVVGFLYAFCSSRLCKLGCCPLFSMDAIYRGAIFSVSAN